MKYIIIILLMMCGSICHADKRHPGMYLDNFTLFYQPVTAGANDSPLQQPINRIKVLKLNRDQNTFFFTATSINYNSEEQILYSWKINDREWSIPSKENRICFCNLHSGEYLVSIRALSALNGQPISQRNLLVIIDSPFWLTSGPFIYHSLLIVLIGFGLILSLQVWKERNLSREAVNIFVNAVRDVCLPLTLIRNPLENLYQSTSSEPLKNILSQVKKVDHLYNKLMTIGRVSLRHDQLLFVESELNTFLNEVIREVSPLAEQKNISLLWDGTPGFYRVWMDKEKIMVVLKGILELIIENHDKGGEINMTTACSSRNWKLELDFVTNVSIKKKLVF